MLRLAAKAKSAGYCATQPPSIEIGNQIVRPGAEKHRQRADLPGVENSAIACFSVRNRCSDVGALFRNGPGRCNQVSTQPGQIAFTMPWLAVSIAATLVILSTPCFAAT
jgi:hypothetical protein